MKDDTIFVPHDHTCKCGTTWHHDPIEVITLALDGKEETASEINQKSHTCPTCGREEYQIDDNDKAPQFLCDGRVCQAISERVPTVDTLETHTKRKAFKARLQLERFLGGFHA